MGVNGIYGLSSGLDIDSLVTQAMKAKQNQYDSMYRKEQTAEWTKDAYNEWYKKLTDFQNNTLYKYALSSGMDPKATASSNSNVVTATAGGSAANISHQVTVTDLSSNAYLKSTETINTANGRSTSSINLSDFIGISNVVYTPDKGGDTTKDKLTFTMDGKNFTLTGSQMDKTALSFTIKDGTSVKNTDTGITAPTSYQVKFSYRDLSDGTFNDLAARIDESGTNVSAQYDSVHDSFSLYNKLGGAADNVDITVDNDTSTLSDGTSTSTSTITDRTTKLLNSLSLGKYNASSDSLGTPVSFSTSSNPITGTDGSVKIDGKTYTTSGNTISVDGVTYTLISKSPSTTDSNNVTTYASSVVSVSTDIDTIVKNVKQFVDDYNSILSGLKDDINEKPDKDYTPLTDADKKTMSSDQITAWEKKAKQGLLYNDSTLSNLVSNMRSAVNQTVGGIGGGYNSLNNIGVSVSSDWTSDKSGILSLDESKLRQALSKDPDSVYKLFANPAASSDTTSYGIVKKLNNVITSSVGTGSIETASGIRGLAGVTDSTNISDQSFWGKKISDWKDKMSDFQTAMDKYRDSLYSQFDAMETAISNLNSQAGYISSFLG